MAWHNKEVEEVLKELNSSEGGLSADEVKQRARKYGPNQLADTKKKPFWLMFLGQFTDFMVLVLIAAAIISGVIGELTDKIIILVIVVLNAVLGFVQEFRAEKAMEALKKMAASNAVVRRSGKERSVPAHELVPGDIVLLEAGNVVPADLRLIETHSILADESSLTGESVAVEKNVAALKEEDLLPGDRSNMVFKTSLVTAGRATGVVVGTGMKTEIGKIAGMLEQEEVVTPLQKRMTDFGKKLSYVILGICVLLFGIGLLRGEDTMRMLLLSISLAVAAIPEALPALITIALSMGAKRMVKVDALMRKLHAVETLGSVTYICSDKTGTLTLNKMKIVDVTEEKDTDTFHGQLSPLNLAMILNNDVKRNEDGELAGDPTEVALVDYVNENEGSDSIAEIKKTFKRVAELPFDSDRKCMTTVHKLPEGKLVLTKGAVEAIVELLGSSEENKRILDQAETWAGEGRRVLAFAYRKVSEIAKDPKPEDLEKELRFAGLVAMQDPARPEAREAIAECKTAGIVPVMITGDHPSTASVIAEEIGILGKDKKVLTGKELQAMKDNDFEAQVEEIAVYARVSPEQKLKIVKALQKKNHYVAMTGDGVNDAPSLKAANIGVAMGINGSDVSKQASHMILLDDNFATIIKAVREGRRIYDNIRRFIKYIMTCNSAEIWTIFLAPLFGLPMPLLPIHILWINLVTDGLPGLALAGEKAEPDVMSRPPRKTDENLFARGVGYHIVWVGLLMAGITLGSQAYAYYNDNEKWQTIVFTVLTFSQLGHVLAIRSDTQLLFRQGLLSNKAMLGAVLLTFVIHLGVVYLPVANHFFKTQPLSFNELAACVGVSAIIFHAVELEKIIKNYLRMKHSN